jgi:hypothetical protein
VVEDDELVGEMLVRKMLLEDRSVFDWRMLELQGNVL